MKVRSTRYPEIIYELSPEHPDIKLGDLCEEGFQLRPHIVWFGEAVPMMSIAAKLANEADIFVIIGTSMNVYPAAGLLDYVNTNIPVYLIDPKEVRTNRRNINIIRMGASEGVRELRRLLSEIE